MSYTPTPTNALSTTNNNLRDVLTDAALRLFVSNGIVEMTIPSKLGLGRKTFEAIRVLLTTPTRWFSVSDKVEYLLESRTLRPYRHFWGLLAGVFTPPRTSVVSDLFAHVQYKLRALLFIAMAERVEHHPLLPVYFNRYCTDGWRDRTLTLLLASSNLEPTVRDGLRKCAERLAVEAIDDLRHNGKGSMDSVISSFFHGYNKLRAASQWNRTKTISYLETAKPVGEDTMSVGCYFASRALLRASHLVNQPRWSEQWVQQLVHRTEDPSYGAKFAAYAALYYRNHLSHDDAQKILTPFLVTAAWDKEAIDHFLNETIVNTGEKWYQENPHRRASNIIRLIVYLRAHPRPSLFWEMPTARLRARNVLGSFWRQEKRQPKQLRIGVLPFGQAVFTWADRLDSYLSIGKWA